MGGIDPVGQRMIAVCMAGCVLFNYPILALFNVRATLFGVPLLYAYIFIAWALVVLVMARVVDRDD